MNTDTANCDLLPLISNQCVLAGAMTLQFEGLPMERVIHGQPRVGTAVLGQLGEHTVGVWEITPSVSTDVEVDEIFIVLAGEAVVRFANGDPDIVLRRGSVGRLTAGSATTWLVSRTLRKIFIS